MVDRFSNGDPANDPAGTIPWKHDWYKPFGNEGKDGQTFYKHFVFSRFGGGDLQGLRERLPYLRELGVNALYLMPMFQASTPHKYNTMDYVHVDEHFGTKGDWAPAAAKEQAGVRQCPHPARGCGGQDREVREVCTRLRGGRRDRRRSAGADRGAGGHQGQVRPGR